MIPKAMEADDSAATNCTESRAIHSRPKYVNRNGAQLTAYLDRFRKGYPNEKLRKHIKR